MSSEIQTNAAADSPIMHRKPVSLKRDAFWTGIDTLVSGGSGLLFRLILARFLAPAEFGVLAMAATVLSIVQVVSDFGLSATVIQRAEERFDERVLNTAFTASSMISGALFVITLLGVAPLAGWYFHDGEVTRVAAVLGLGFLFVPSISIIRALLFRNRDFRTVTLARLVATAISIVCAFIFLAFEASVWVLVTQQLLAQAALTVVLHLSSPWQPKLRLDRSVFKEMFGFSGLVLASDVLSSAAKNFDVFVMGLFLSSGPIGLYSMAFYLTDTVRANLMSVLTRVMFTHYSSIRDNNAEVRRAYVRTIRWNSDVLFPIMIVFIIFGPDLFTHFAGPEWKVAGFPLQMLAVAAMINTAGGTTSSLYRALGRPGLDLALFLFTSCIVLLPGLVVGVLYAGINGAAVAYAANKVIAVIIRQVLLDRLIGRTAIPVIREVLCSLLFMLPLVVVALAGRLIWADGGWLRDLALSTILLSAYGVYLGERMTGLFRKTLTGLRAD